jgi:diguanylate cyclase (GGDEF)-like protein/PAS domain S-box-containing protein
MGDFRDESFEGSNDNNINRIRLKPLLGFVLGLALIKVLGISIRWFLNLKGLLWEFFIDDILMMILILPHMLTSIKHFKSLKETKKQLTLSREKYQSVVNSVKEIIFQVDREGKWTFLNSAWHEITGFSIEDSLGKPLWDYVLTKNRRQIMKVFDSLIKGKIENCSYEITSISRKGEHFWIEIFAQVVRNPEGEIIGVSGIITDVTARKDMEKELKKRDKILGGISESTNILLESTDYEKAFEDALKKLGEITEINRINICSYKFPDGQKIEYSWSDNKDYEQKKYSQVPLLYQNKSLEGWIKILENGRLVAGTLSNFDGYEREALNFLGIKSIVILPIIVDKEFTGYIELIDYINEREWSNIGKTTLLTASKGIGSAIKRIRGEEELKKALKNDFTTMVKNLQNIVFRLKYNEAGEFYYTLFEGKVAVAQGYTTERVYGKTIKEVVGQEKADYLYPYYKRAFEGEYVNYEFEFNNRITMGTLSPIFENEKVVEVIGSVVDITDKKEAEKKIQHMAYYDMLTDLPNRVLFSQRLWDAIRAAEAKNGQIAVMYFDLDNFKRINDTLGHTTGDLVLKEVSKRLRNITNGKELVSRMGGDEFILLISDIESEDYASQRAGEILNVFKPSFNIDGNEFFITPSIGISIYPSDGQNMEELIRNADMAMYRAKEYGKNNYQFYNISMNSMAIERLTMENDLRRAIDNNELYLVYQPKVDITSGKIVGCEALIRWNHPEKGLVSPAEFIPFAEESGLIVPIGEWALYTACRQNRLWQEMGCKNIRMSVNISAVQFHQGNLIGTVRKVLEETNLDPIYLELEITENIIMQNTEKVQEDLRKLKKMGISISVDDFGTGFSSLSYLKKFSIDIIKIDQSFIKDINNNPNDEAIVTAIINMAKGLNLRVIAEGVETKEQLFLLGEKKCNEIQGYLSGKPMISEEFYCSIHEECGRLQPLELSSVLEVAVSNSFECI